MPNRAGGKALKVLAGLNGEALTPAQVRNADIPLCQLHAQTDLKASPALVAFYGQINRKESNAQKRRARLAAFDEIAAAAFTREYREQEQEKNGYRRPACTAFAVLADVCEAGRAAKIVMSSDGGEMRAILAQVEDWQALPIEALEHALESGVIFPLAEKPLTVEVLDGLAARLTHGENLARQLALALPENAEFESLQALCWAQALSLAAMRSFDWASGKNDPSVGGLSRPETPPKEGAPGEKGGEMPDVGFALVRCFARIETAALPLFYTLQILSEENAALLPPMHRWGLYCVWALDALDAGKPQEYLALLRKGLAACPGQKEMVQFLLGRFLEDARPKAAPKLLALAERVRTILAACGPNDPAARAVRESSACKQVAWIIEETPGLPVQ